MDKKQTVAILGNIMDADVPDAASIKELLNEADSRANNPDGLTARERINALFDDGTFMESGAYVRRDNRDAAFEGVICGWGSVCGRLVFAFAQDHSRTKGAMTEKHAKKIAEIYRLAIENGAPVIGLFDSAGALIPEGIAALSGYGEIMKCVTEASGVIPQIAIIPGACAGSSSVIAGMFDFIIISDKKGSISFNPPFVVGQNTAKTEFVTKNGLAALSSDTDEGCIAKAKELISYLPMNNAEGTVEEISNDDINRAIDISSFKESGDMISLITAVSDNGKFFELYKDFAPEALTGFITLGGTVCGIVANNKSVSGGALTASAARKLARVLSFCDCFDIPVITLVDSKGTDISAEAEAAPYVAELAKLTQIYASAKCPLVTVLAGEAYGAVYSVMGSKALGADVVLALDSAKVGAMCAERAVAFMWNDKISATVSREELESKWDSSVNSAANAAKDGQIDFIVDDCELRVRIAGAVMMLSAKSKNCPLKRHGNMPL